MYVSRSMDDATAILIFISTLLGTLLTISELLAISKCRPNSIGELFFKNCTHEEV